MSERRNLSTGGAWEPIIGFPRAVQVQNLIYASGTTATNAHVCHGHRSLGGIRTRSRWIFNDILPATSIVEVSKLILPKMMVEIDADAEL